MFKRLTYFQAAMSTSALFCHVLDSDSEILKLIFFFFKNVTSTHYLKDYFWKFSYGGGHATGPPSVARLQTQSTADTKKSRRKTVSSLLIQSAYSTIQQRGIKGKHWCVCVFVCGGPSKNCAQGPLPFDPGLDQVVTVIIKETLQFVCDTQLIRHLSH